MIYKMWRGEFHLKALTLNYDSPEDFTRCHWQKKERVLPIWIIYRAILASYFLISFFYSLIIKKFTEAEEIFIKYPIFLTHWTYFVETIYFVLGLIVVVLKAFDEDKKKFVNEPMKIMPWYYKIFWVLYTIVLPGSFAVSTIFWLAVYDPETFPITVTNIMVHALNSILLFLELIFVAHPTKMLHFYWPILYGFCYCIFSVIYQLSGGTGVQGMVPIYKILDWRYPVSAVLTSTASLSFLIILHILFVLLHLLKIVLRKKVIVSQEQQS